MVDGAGGWGSMGPVSTGCDLLNGAKRLRRCRATTGDGYPCALFLPRSCISTVYVSQNVAVAIAEMSAVALHSTPAGRKG